MDVFLSIAAVILALAGLAGCILPVLPGPPVSYAALLLVSAASYSSMSWQFLLLWLGITAAVTAADYYLPVVMTRSFGGSKSATVGTVAGMIAGFFVFPPWGIIICPFFGALIGEIWGNRSSGEHAFRVAMGAFLAFILGTGAKIVVCAVMLYYVSREMIV